MSQTKMSQTDASSLHYKPSCTASCIWSRLSNSRPELQQLAPESEQLASDFRKRQQLDKQLNVQLSSLEFATWVEGSATWYATCLPFRKCIATYIATCSGRAQSHPYIASNNQFATWLATWLATCVIGQQLDMQLGCHVGRALQLAAGCMQLTLQLRKMDCNSSSSSPSNLRHANCANLQLRRKLLSRLRIQLAVQLGL